jgi:hypothetical protein
MAELRDVRMNGIQRAGSKLAGQQKGKLEE